MVGLSAHHTSLSSLPATNQPLHTIAPDTQTTTTTHSLNLSALKHFQYSIGPKFNRTPNKNSLYSHGPNFSKIPKQNHIICMAHPRRVKMVAQQIRRELADMLLKDKVLQQAILPETALGADKYLSSLTTISDVEVSGDLQVVKVYVSVYGDDRGREIAIEGLKAKNKYVRSELGKRMKLRMTPEVRFIEDDSLERGSRVIAILERLKQEREKKEKNKESVSNDLDIDIQPTQTRSIPVEKKKQTESSEDEDWISDDDEDLIYIK